MKTSYKKGLTHLFSTFQNLRLGRIKMHNAHALIENTISREPSVCCFVFLGQRNHDEYRISRPIPFGWSMCDIRFCVSWKNHKMHFVHPDRCISVGRCAICGFVFIGQKNHKINIAHLDRCRSVSRWR